MLAVPVWVAPGAWSGGMKDVVEPRQGGEVVVESRVSSGRVGERVGGGGGNRLETIQAAAQGGGMCVRMCSGAAWVRGNDVVIGPCAGDGEGAVGWRLSAISPAPKGNLHTLGT